MMSRIVKLFVLCAALAMFSANAWAQSSATAELHVAVKDPGGALVKNATVTATNQARNIEHTLTLTETGEYQFLSLPPGQYTVSVQAPGFGRSVAKNVTITVGQRAELPITLTVAAVESVVDVNSEPELVETQRSAPTQTINQIRIDNLPINGRNYIEFALTDSKLARDTAPSIGAAPTSGLNVGGQRARSNLVNVDGADAVDNSTNGIRATVSQEAVQEFQIITNGYNAEYGRASGGVINIITRGGTNALHGSAFGYLRNRNIQAVNRFSTLKDPAYTRYQTGFTLGGPLKKDKTFYFLSYETTRRNESGYSSIGANSFDLVPFNAAALAPFIGGANFGTIMLTPAQATFLSSTAGAIAALPPATQAALLGGGVGTLLAKYMIVAGGGAGVAVNGTMPSLTMAGAVAQGLLTAPYFAGQTPCFSSPGVPCANIFPSSGYPLPANFVPLQQLVGNFPVHEGTSIASLRLDHRLSSSQQLMFRFSASPSTVTGIQVQAQGPQSLGLNAWSRTSQNTSRDVSGTLQHAWTIGNNKVNEFRFQYSRRGLIYNFANATDAAGRPTGSFAGINVPGYAYFGREPFSFVRRSEQRYQMTDNFSIAHGAHNFKFGADVNYLPLKADFTVNFGAVYNFGGLTASSLGFPSAVPSLNIPIPNISPVQAYGLGIPQYFLQGVGNPHDEFSNKTLGVFLQDTWRLKPNLTLNYGVRYDIEFTPTFPAVNAMSQAAQDAFGITQGIPRDSNNIAPRIGLAWDPWSDGKTVFRASFGMFYDHPLLALAFDSDVADMSQAPQVLSFGSTPGFSAASGLLVTCLNATNLFQGIASNCLPASFNYLANEQRFNTTPNAPSVFVGQQYLAQNVPVLLQPFGFPTGKNFVYAYSNQANLGYEHDMGHNISISIEYNFNGGHHLNRPINVNATRGDLLLTNFQRAVAGVNAMKAALTAAGAGAAAAGLPNYTSPLSVTACPTLLKGQLQAAGVPAALLGSINAAPAGNWTSAPLVSFFRPSGLNPSLTTNFPFSLCMGEANSALTEFHLGKAVTIPFSDLPANFSNGSSVYHGLTMNLKKRFSSHYEFLASYTWSHAIDDSTDLQSPLAPQDNYHPEQERSNSSFDQRHRFVFSAVFQSGKVGSGFTRTLFSDWTFAPILDFSSGRPFNVITGEDRNFDLGSTDRPMAVSGAGTNACGDVAVATQWSPTGWVQPACFLNGTLSGTLGRNTGVKPWTIFNDVRVARRIHFTERVALDAMVDIFNVANRVNVADVNTFWNIAGRPAAAYDPRQFQLALKLVW
jgi:hypothetical protein